MRKLLAGEHGRRAARMTPTLTALALVFTLSGCAQVPDWVNPTTWVDDVNPISWYERMFDSDDEVERLPKVPATAKKSPDGDKPFPKLGDAPTAKSGSTEESRKELADSLIADRDNARYTDQNLRAGDQRMAAALPQPNQAPPPAAKPSAPPAPMADKQVAAVPVVKELEALPTAPTLPASPALPPAPQPVVDKAPSATSVPSIVQRRGSLPPPPSPIAEVSRGSIPQVVQQSGRAATGTVGLPKPPAVMPSIVQPAAAPGTAPLKLIPPSGQMVAAIPPSVRINLPVGQEQSILAQTYAASLAAQSSSVVRQPGSVFNAPNAAPIAGQWSTVVPGVVRQAFNASLTGASQGVQIAAPNRTPVLASVIASPQMSNETMRRLPGAPILIRFRHGSARLSGKERKSLARMAGQAKSQGRTLVVVGHASQRTGDMNYAKHKLVNFGISLDRANKVAGELRRQGVAAQQIVVEAKGDSEPLYFEFMPNGEAKNRRVEVFIR
ncbi:MAG: OmpA family protein [Rhodospirillaceae bacterium]|nr:OmpA family protein [Rhodospirillaceae bacterium]MBT5194056.1 OmpA family protein [Rhodospirillaceae bacterium]MBT5895741.1 OmpA family protein [Rhodospirillaceae bacterium]MBT6430396.1 OmpA family protein [Rhodospirillaceae bacterium]